MKKFLIKICALLTVSSMLIGVVFMSDFATAYSMAAANTVETPESSRDALKKYKEISEINNDTILGVDFTYYQQCLTWGKQYKNYMSQPIDNLFTYVKSQGINTISVKVAVNPTRDNAYLSLDNAIKTLKEAKAAGLQTNLVLLYSDEMTYAGAQKLPVGWTSDNATEKAKAYTTEVVEKLKKESATPTIITIGNEASLLKVLSDNGVNYIRIRIWNDPYNEKGETYGGGASDVENGLKIAREAAKYNMKLLLCFHYSDFWAEPSVQKLPKAWKKDANNQEKLRADVYNFTKETIEKFKAVGADIGMVQVGNEISQGMMDVMRDENNSELSVWSDQAKSKVIDSYINEGTKAVREYAPNALIALHLNTLYTGIYKDAMDAWERDNVDYDVFGASCYAFWVGDNVVNDIKRAGNYVASRGKLFTILETSWFNSTEDADGTGNMESSTNLKSYKVGPQGQVDVLADMYDAVLTNDNGLGIFYWEGAWIPVKAGWTNWKYNKEMADKYGTGWASQGAVGYFPNWKMYYNGQPAWGGDSWDNQTLFDTKGYPLDSLRFYKDAVSSKEKQQIAIIELCSQSGGIIGYKYVKVSVGKSITYTLPVVTGYKAVKTKIQIKGEKEGIKRVQATYKMLPKKQNICLKKSSYKLPYASNYNFKKQVIANGKLTFKSSNSKVIYINKRTGKMTIKKPGKVTITINAGSTAFYKAAKKRVTVYAVPKKQTLQRVRKSGRTIKVTVKKDVKATGYQVVTSTNKKFKRNKKSVVSKNNRRLSLTLRQNAKGTYYVRARSYIKIGKKSYYASWSKVKKIVLK